MSKYNKLVVLSSCNLEKRIVTLFGLEDLAKSIAIEYWDIADITYHESFPDIIIPGIKQIKVTSKYDFKRRISSINDYENTLFAVYVNYSSKTSFCFRMLSLYKKDMLYCINGVLPKVEVPFNLERYSFNQFVESIKNRIWSILKKTPMFAPLKYELRTCKCAVTDYKIDNKTKIIPFNSTDFVNAQSESLQLIDGKYIVFIDQYIPYHPDNMIGGRVPIDADTYYKQLNSFFSHLEARENCKVVIAAHPASSSYRNKNPFGGRDIHFGKTKALCQYAYATIAHFSTAIFYSVIYRNPILFVTSDEINLQMREAGLMIRSMAIELGCGYLNLSDKILDYNLCVDELKYSNYLYRYITNPESEKMDNSKIILNILNGNI